MGRLKFGKEKKRVNFDLLRVVGIWTFQIAVVCQMCIRDRTEGGDDYNTRGQQKDYHGWIF